jgi:hypothetical protein
MNLKSIEATTNISATTARIQSNRKHLIFLFTEQLLSMGKRLSNLADGM